MLGKLIEKCLELLEAKKEVAELKTKLAANEIMLKKYVKVNADQRELLNDMSNKVAKMAAEDKPKTAYSASEVRV